MLDEQRRGGLSYATAPKRVMAVRRWFVIKKTLENKAVEVDEIEGPEARLPIIEAARRRYRGYPRQ